MDQSNEIYGPSPDIPLSAAKGGSSNARLPARSRRTTRGWSSKASGAAIQRNRESFIRVCSATARFPRAEVIRPATRSVSARKLASSLRKARIL